MTIEKISDDQFERLLAMFEEIRKLKEFAKAIKEVGENKKASLAKDEGRKG